MEAVDATAADFGQRVQQASLQLQPPSMEPVVEDAEDMVADDMVAEEPRRGRRHSAGQHRRQPQQLRPSGGPPHRLQQEGDAHEVPQSPPVEELQPESPWCLDEEDFVIAAGNMRQQVQMLKLLLAAGPRGAARRLRTSQPTTLAKTAARLPGAQAGGAGLLVQLAGLDRECQALALQLGGEGSRSLKV